MRECTVIHVSEGRRPQNVPFWPCSRKERGVTVGKEKTGPKRLKKVGCEGELTIKPSYGGVEEPGEQDLLSTILLGIHNIKKVG